MNVLLSKVDIGDEVIIKPGQFGQTIKDALQFNNAGILISIIVKNVFILAGILLFVLLIMGGIKIISGAGESDSKKAASGKQAVTNAIMGFLIIFCSYWIILLIEKITGLKIFNPTI